MKARVNGWTIEADVVRDLGSTPHRVEVQLGARMGLGPRVAIDLEMPAAEAVEFAAFLDDLQHAVDRASDADECDRCGMPCDPGETYCSTCEEARR